MNTRENVRAALNHEQPSRVPLDFGATAVSGIHVSCVAALRAHYGLEQRPVKVHEPYQMLGWLDDDLRDAIGVDFDSVWGRTTIFGFPNEDWTTWRTPWGQEVLVSGMFKTKTEPNGDVLIYPAGDTGAAPSGRMSRAAYFFDSIIRQPPLDEDRLDPADNLEEFGPIADEDLAHFKARLGAVAGTGRAIVASLPGMALGDIALVPAPFLRQPKGIRDVAEWYVSTVARQDYVHAVFAKQTEFALGNLAKLHAVLGDGVDVTFICGTDFGTQASTFCSPETFDSLYAPCYKQINGWIHARTGWKTFKHSCGAIATFMDRFIDAGFDIINPVQCSAAGMDPAALKSKYGSRITFWGGGVDTQKTLPFGTPDAVRTEVLKRCALFAPGGGFVFNAIHNVQAKTPTANIVAMIEAVREFNGAGG
ncbi:MAG: methyltransferase [Kiritimatiellae bacterium]|nr:methyltransferase [Kiritimatiellia bacterium]